MSVLALVQLSVVINDLEKGLSTSLGEFADGAQLFMALRMGTGCKELWRDFTGESCILMQVELMQINAKGYQGTALLGIVS